MTLPLTRPTPLVGGLPAPTAAGLVLRQFRDEDAPALVEVYRDPVLRHFTQDPVTDGAAAARWLDVQRRGWTDGDRYSFAVEEEGGALVANVVLKRGAADLTRAEVGYWTAAAARGRGVAPRALEALTRWAFEVFAADGLVRLDLLHQVDNQASCRVAEKTGYRFETVLPARPPFPLDGHLHSRAAVPAG